jgi:phosphoglycerate dehydrogenase-like enzyme
MNKLRIFVDLVASTEALELLRQGTRGHELVFPQAPAASVLHQVEWDPGLAAADIAFGQPAPQAVTEARQLKWIQVSSSGITRYDNPAFRALVAQRNIAVSNSASVYDESCAVHTLGFMLAQARKLPLGLRTRTAGGSHAWHALREASGNLRGESVLIVGFGAIGKYLVKLLGPFEMKIRAYRRKARGDEGVPVVPPAQLPRALGEADHVINILPDSAETRHFFDRTRFGALKPGATFYNIGRGATVDQAALLEALQSGRLSAAWLDVTEPEPLPDNHPLWAQPNCHITPHVAGGHTHEAHSLVRHFLRNFERFVRGEPVLDRVM